MNLFKYQHLNWNILKIIIIISSSHVCTISDKGCWEPLNTEGDIDVVAGVGVTTTGSSLGGWNLRVPEAVSLANSSAVSTNFFAAAKRSHRMSENTKSQDIREYKFTSRKQWESQALF